MNNGVDSVMKTKKMLVLFGSPNGHGFTQRLLSSFLQPFQENKAWEITTIDAYQANIHPCTACRTCAKKEGCAFDDFHDIDKALRQSDLLVVAAPVYNCSFPAPMKAILDRTQQYFEARFSLGKNPPIKKHREAVLILTMGSEEDFAIEVTTHQLNRAFSVMNTQLTGCVVWEATDQMDKNRGPATAKARALGEKYCLGE